mmetsp:Transcript_96541/g.191347  ORF Transcript_96541/g.191347 Transcript_96541/m.191347 type:complete len:537 (+) Transcript_96541:78-1688(+)|eukprot:CAMPEP_0172671858 /NCGR_PEP_ID=MMETSP1074-20121228/11183_1 /TAXON_ID=2916 /ORGANISM="Ceratium fusus, Strain PA161109" /LENGTH=536 /DNA_ID=CAMNT_0013488971 /DNA_START=47 /DNA_END=1657 /DNA_ORIENTATION=+
MPQRKRPRTGVEIPIVWPEGEAPARRGEALWDFNMPSVGGLQNPQVAEPSPMLELKRAQSVAKLRQKYAEACRDVLGLAQPPADSVDRWILEQLAQPRRNPGTSGDPLLPRPRIAETSQVLLRELLAEVPTRCPSRVFGPPALELLQRYHRNAENWLGRLPHAPTELSDEVEVLGKWIARNVNGGAQKSRSRGECPYRQKLDELTEDGGLSACFRPLVEPLALKVVQTMSSNAEALVIELHTGAKALGPVDSEPAVSLEEPTQDGRKVELRFENDTICISGMHLAKLRKLYELHHPHDEKSIQQWECVFRRRLYVMLRRYITFIGLDPAEEGHKGGNMHAAAPEPVFAWLKARLEVRCELFASPLNCYFPRFFSAFPDTDAAFGSLGSFFDARALPDGSYEVGPPYTEEVLELTARRLLELLLGAGVDNALSFTLFVPDWEGAAALNLLASPAFAAFRRGIAEDAPPFLLAPGREHGYVSGVQFFADVGADSSRRYYVVPHGTRVYVLQTAAGAQRWPFTTTEARQLLQQMRPIPS